MFGKKNNLEKKIKLNISSKDLESDFKKRLLAQQSSSDLKGFRKGKEIYVVRGGFNKTMIFISKFIPNKVLRFLFGSLVNFGK